MRRAAAAAVAAATAGAAVVPAPLCGLNGEWDAAGAACRCDAGWRGAACGELDLAPAAAAGYGLRAAGAPTWGGGAVWEGGRWHLIVGARAEATADAVAADYPCDSRIVRAVSAGADPAGPYTIEAAVVGRSSWEPGLARGPGGELLMMFFGNISGAPPVGSAACRMPSDTYNLTTTNTYVTISASGSAAGPWSAPRVVKGMENRPGAGKGPCSWRCASGNPSPAWHPNGTLYAAVRHNTCWRGCSAREHLGLWRADGGWDGEWTPVSRDAPLFGWGNSSAEGCKAAGDACPTLEDPHLWWDRRGAHILAHGQNNHTIHQTRGAYGWSVDGVQWVLDTPPASGLSAWTMHVEWQNGSATPLARRQRPSLVRDPVTGAPTHLINGADFAHHQGPGPGWCEGCHWGTGMTLIQPLRRR